MRLRGPRLVFGVCLGGDQEGVNRTVIFDELHQCAIWAGTRNMQTNAFDFVTVRIVHFKTVTVPLRNGGCTVCFCDD